MTSAPLISVDGLVGPRSLTAHRLLDVAFVDRCGRIVVSFVDVFAMIRLDRSAEIVLVELVDGSSTALTVRDVVRCDEIVLQLEMRVGSHRFVPRLRSTTSDRSFTGTPIRGLRAMTFAAFVGSAR